MALKQAIAPDEGSHQATDYREGSHRQVPLCAIEGHNWKTLLRDGLVSGQPRPVR